MALLYTETLLGVRASFWALSESSTELEALLRDDCLLSRIKDETSSVKRLKERIVAHILLRYLVGFSGFIRHDEEGRPFCEGVEGDISVSHCKECVAVAISDGKVGIDVESIGERQFALAERFLSDIEMGYLSRCSKKEMYAVLLWSAKEAIYKLVSENGLSYTKDIFIPEFVLFDAGEATAWCNTKTGRKDVLLSYRFDNGFISVVALFRYAMNKCGC